MPETVKPYTHYRFLPVLTCRLFMRFYLAILEVLLNTLWYCGTILQIFFRTLREQMPFRYLR